MSHLRGAGQHARCRGSAHTDWPAHGSLVAWPLALDRPAPFGFGAFIITRRRRNEAEFDSYAHGYGAGYDACRMRKDSGRLLSPESVALIHTNAPPFSKQGVRFALRRNDHHRRFIPRSGLIRNIHADIPRDELVHAGRIGDLKGLVLATTTPLQRLRNIHHEAEAAWLWWVIACCAPRLRRHLLAAHTAWRKLKAAKSSYNDFAAR